MAKLVRLAVVAAVVFGMPTAAFAQAAPSPHLHAPPAVAAQSAPAQPQRKANHESTCQCPCCQMMHQMMQMMEKQSGDVGCMQKMKMMQGQGAQEKPAPPREHEKH